MNKKTLKTRVINNWKTSIIGIVILIVAIVMGITGKATLTEIGAIAPFILTCIVVKDSILKLD